MFVLVVIIVGGLIDTPASLAQRGRISEARSALQMLRGPLHPAEARTAGFLGRGRSEGRPAWACGCGVGGGIQHTARKQTSVLIPPLRTTDRGRIPGNAPGMHRIRTSAGLSAAAAPAACCLKLHGGMFARGAVHSAATTAPEHGTSAACFVACLRPHRAAPRCRGGGCRAPSSP